MKHKEVVIPIAIAGAYSAFIGYYFQKAFLRDKPRQKPDRENLDTSLLNYITYKISSFDHLDLYGYFYQQHSQNTVILVHGFHSNAFYEYHDFLPFYLSEGFNILVIDMRSHGQSEGKKIGYGYLEKRDLIDWTEFILDKLGPHQNIIYHGISMGAATVLQASGEKDLPPQVKAIIADCGYDSLENELSHVVKQMGIPRSILFPGVDALHRLVYGYPMKRVNTASAVEKTSVPILYIHGLKDDFVPTYMVNTLYNHTRSRKQLYLVPEAKHAKSHRQNPIEYEKTVKEFLLRFL